MGELINEEIIQNLKRSILEGKGNMSNIQILAMIIRKDNEYADEVHRHVEKALLGGGVKEDVRGYM